MAVEVAVAVAAGGSVTVGDGMLVGVGGNAVEGAVEVGNSWITLVFVVSRQAPSSHAPAAAADNWTNWRRDIFFDVIVFLCCAEANGLVE